MNKSNKELLVISSGFPNKTGDYLAHTFVKGYVNEAKDYYRKVTVLALIPMLPIFNKVFNKNYSELIKDYSYDNVNVRYMKYPFIPFWPISKFKGWIAYYFLSSKILDSFSEQTIIHANFTSPAGVFAYYLSKKLRSNFVLTVHEDHNWLVNQVESRNSMLIQTWKKAKLLIRVNKLDNALLSKYNKVVTIPNGFNHRVFKPMDRNVCRNSLKIEPGKKVIVNIGFYNEQKNQKLLIDAILLLPKKHLSELKCFIIGGGPKHEELENYVKNNKLKKNVVLVGQLEHDSLPIYLNAADIFCLSSNSEGNPTVMFEALAVGLPYVGTNVGGVPEIITSDEIGLICPPNDANELSQIIEKGLVKQWNRQEIMKYGNQFSWKNIFLETKQYY